MATALSPNSGGAKSDTSWPCWAKSNADATPPLPAPSTATRIPRPPRSDGQRAPTLVGSPSSLPELHAPEVQRHRDAALGLRERGEHDVREVDRDLLRGDERGGNRLALGNGLADRGGGGVEAERDRDLVQVGLAGRPCPADACCR